MRPFTLLSASLILVIFLSVSFKSAGQTITAEELEGYKRQVTDLVIYFEGTLNFLGDPKSIPREKEVVINDTYLKIFKSDKVQVEDDLDEDREVPLHKDVQAYLKDVDFFFRSAVFKFHIIDISHFTGENDFHFFKVTFNRDLDALTIAGDSVKSRRVRYMEVNLNIPMNELKIASIYTTRLDEREAMRNWWNGLSKPWRTYFGGDVKIWDTISLADIVHFYDTTVVIGRSEITTIADTGNYYGFTLPTERERGLTDHFTDTIFINPQPIIAAIATVMRTQEVDISGNVDIRSLEPLSELSELVKVNCSHSLVSSIHPLRNLNKLKSIDFSNTPVDDISSLQYSTSVNEINSGYTLVTDLQPFERLVNLTKLDISGLRIDRIDFLKSLVNLERLSLSHARITYLGPVSGLTKINELDVSHTLIKSLDTIVGLINMKFLNCEKTSVASLEPLSGMENLTGLNINYTLVESLTPLGNLQNLKRIYWESDHLFPEEKEAKRKEAITYMRDHPHTLVIFDLEDLLDSWKNFEQPWKEKLSEIANLSPEPDKDDLPAIFLIEEMDLSNSNITTLIPVKQLYNIRLLDVSSTQVTDFSPLSDAIELVVLNVSNTAVNDIDFAEKLYKLAELRLENSEVNSLSPVSKLSGLKYIYADNTKIDDEEAFFYVASNPGSIVIYKSASLREWWDQLPGGWRRYFSLKYAIDLPATREQLHTVLFTNAVELMEDNEIRTLEPLTILMRLRTLKMSNLVVSDLSPIAGLKSLEELKAGQMPVADLSPVTGLNELTLLHIMNTSVKDLRPVSGLSGILDLNISGTHITNLKALSNLHNLEHLDLSNTRVRSLKPIRNLSSLKSVKCFNTRISQKEVDRFKASNPDCQVVYY